MSYDNTLGSPRPDSTDWNNALDAIKRLAAARRGALNEIEPTYPATATRGAKTIRSIAPSSTAKHVASMDQDQLERDIAEIEKASAALRRVEPALQAWAPDEAPAREPKKLRSIWILIGTIWVSTVLVTGGAIGAILYLLG